MILETECLIIREYTPDDFDALYKECSEILKSIPPEKKEYYRPRIEEIIGRNLGKGKKISQITRNQVEQLSLIIFDLTSNLQVKQFISFQNSLLKI